MPTGYSPSAAESSECKFGDHDRAHCLCAKYYGPDSNRVNIAKEEQTHGIYRSSRTDYGFFALRSTYPGGAPLAHKEKKEEYCKGKEVKGKAKKKED
jgi:hypothetical protein